MNPIIAEKSADIAELCRRYDVRQLEVFDPAGKDIILLTRDDDMGFLVEFDTDKNGLDLLRHMINLEEDLGKLLHCKVDLTRRRVIEKSENHLFRNDILNNLESVYG